MAANDPSSARSESATLLLEACARGESEALEKLLPLVYHELRRQARRQLQKERSDHTLQTTALVHEAWIRLVGEHQRNWENRSHFLSVAALAMRRILLSHAARKGRLKRGGDRERIGWDEGFALFEDRAHDVVALDESLKRLEEVDPESAKIVELRFFAGLQIPEVARLLSVSERTIERRWRMARAWLRRDMGVAP